MPTLTISEAARLCGVDRTTLQRAIRKGRLSLNPDHTVDTAELLRSGYTLHAAPQVHAAPIPQDTASAPQHMPHHLRHPPAADGTAAELAALRQVTTVLERERDLLVQQLHAALDREAWLRHLLEEQQAQQQRLLAAPTLAPPTPHQRSRRRAPRATVSMETPQGFDSTKYVLGKLCPRRHEYGTTGQSLLRLPRYVCLACDKERARARRQAQRQEG